MVTPMKTGLWWAALAALLAAGTAAQTPDVNRFLIRPVPPRDASLYLSVADVIALQAKGHALQLVDVRPETDWLGTQIPGSVRIPRHEIKVRPALRPKLLVLVDQGWNDRRLENVYRDLAGRGFVAMILDGGINAWLAAGREVTGTGEGRAALAAIAAHEYLSVKSDADRVSIEAAANAASNVVLHVQGGRAALNRQLQDMASMEQSAVRVIEGPGASVASPVVPKPCSSCP